MPSRNRPKLKHDYEVGLQLTITKAGREEHKKRLNLILNRRKVKYGTGTHGSAKFQRTKLGTTGDRHESEHVIGYNVYAEGMDRSRGEGEKIELAGLAYLEVKPLHRAHPGTGSGGAADAYRDNQRAIPEEGSRAEAFIGGIEGAREAALRTGAVPPPAAPPRPKTVSSAVQYNQLEYAHLPDMTGGEDVAIASVSYEAMVRNGPGVTFVQGDKQVSFQISQVERAEMLLAYMVRKNKAWPTQAQIAEVMRVCGLEPIWVQDARTGAKIAQ